MHPEQAKADFSRTKKGLAGLEIIRNRKSPILNSRLTAPDLRSLTLIYMFFLMVKFRVPPFKNFVKSLWVFRFLALTKKVT